MSSLDPGQICCLIVTYDPSEKFFTLLDCIKSQVDRIIIVDNHSGDPVLNRIERVTGAENIYLIKNPGNFGVAKALNQGCELARQMNYQWLIAFDQDSEPFPDIVKKICEVYEIYPDQGKIGAIGVNILLSGTRYYNRHSDKRRYYSRDYLITSGTLLSLDVFNTIGGFREDFFIDNVDLEYSLRLRKNGKVLLITNDVCMIHDPGAPVVKKILGLRIISSGHSIDRRYYIGRNTVLLTRAYLFRFPYFIAKKNFFFFLSLIQLLIAEDDRKAKLTASFRGILDGIRYYGRPGNCNATASRAGRSGNSNATASRATFTRFPE